MGTSAGAGVAANGARAGAGRGEGRRGAPPPGVTASPFVLSPAAHAGGTANAGAPVPLPRRGARKSGRLRGKGGCTEDLRLHNLAVGVSKLRPLGVPPGETGLGPQPGWQVPTPSNNAPLRRLSASRHLSLLVPHSWHRGKQAWISVPFDGP